MIVLIESMHPNYFLSRRFYFFAVCQFLICNAISIVTARPGFDSNPKNTFNSLSDQKDNITEDVTLTLEDIFPNYIVTSEFCDDDSCKQTYEVANYPYEQITDVFPEVSKRLWDQYETSNFSMSVRGRDEDEPESTRAEDYNTTFRMQNVPQAGKDVESVIRTVSLDSYEDPNKSSNRCAETRQTIQPLTGRSDGKEYYITNIKTYSQTVTVIRCYRAGVSCSNKYLGPEGIAFKCKQEYEDTQFSSFPVGESISLESHRKIHLKVPKGCSCSMTWLR